MVSLLGLGSMHTQAQCAVFLGTDDTIVIELFFNALVYE